MDHKFTEQIRQWLETPEAERDYSVGALYLLKLSGNQIMYRNIVAQLDRRHDVVEYQLQKYYNFRVQALTHAQVEEMAAQVETIVAEHIPLAAEADKQPQKGKRADHNSLPDEIKAKYVENLSLLQRMRELHLRLRSLSLENSTCSDSERYPFLKELISLSTRNSTPTGRHTTGMLLPPPKPPRQSRKPPRVNAPPTGAKPRSNETHRQH